MSDTVLKIIPTEPAWTPAPTAATAAERLVRERFCPDIRSIASELTDTINFVDPGMELKSVSCPSCRTALDERWWGERMNEAFETSFTNMNLVPPCCAHPTTLNALDYDWPSGFARFVLFAAGWTREPLTAAELDQVAGVLGYPVRQLFARY